MKQIVTPDFIHDSVADGRLLDENGQLGLCTETDTNQTPDLMKFDRISPAMTPLKRLSDDPYTLLCATKEAMRLQTKKSNPGS